MSLPHGNSKSPTNEGFNRTFFYALYMEDFPLPCLITGGNILRIIMDRRPGQENLILGRRGQLSLK